VIEAIQHFVDEFLIAIGYVFKVLCSLILFGAIALFIRAGWELGFWFYFWMRYPELR
jgi:hypothetical protein